MDGFVTGNAACTGEPSDPAAGSGDPTADPLDPMDLPKPTPKGQFANAEIQGATAAETFSLANPETEIGKLSEAAASRTGASSASSSS